MANGAGLEESAHAARSAPAADGCGHGNSKTVARFVKPGYCVAFVAVTLAGFLQAANAPAQLVPRSSLLPLGLASALYTLLGTAGLYVLERRDSPRSLRVLIALLTALGTACTWFSYGYESMMLLAVVSASVLYLGMAGSVLVSVTCALVALAAFALRASVWSALLQAEIAFGSGIAFVYVFSRIALREQRTRAELQRVAGELALANQQLREHAGEVEQLATVKERNRIAREIHDGIGHHLTVVHVQLQAAQTLFSKQPDRALAALTRCQQLTHEGLNEIRRSVSLLRGSTKTRPPILDALRALADECTAAGVSAQLQVAGAPRRLAEPIEFTLYRAAQEALTNARRHARASHIGIALTFDATGSVRLQVADDGVGSDSPDGGFGLVGLRERAELVGGKVSIRTARSQGFSLELEVPG